MTDATTQLKIGASLDGSFETTANTAKRKIKDIGTAANEAGKSTSGIGDGMAGSAQKVEAATKNMVGSIQRQIAALEAGDKSSRQYQESLARMRGIDTAALKPYLDQLDAAKLKQSEAAKSAESLAGSMGSIRIAAVAIGASLGALAMFSKNIIDAADGLNDLSQRVGISVRELGKYQLAAEQSGTSLESISKGVKGLAKSMVENGDALRKAGIDATSADGAMQQLADVFSEMPDGIEKTTLATKLFGKAGMDLIPMLNLGSEGLRDAALASAEYAEQMAIMAPLADSLNDKMAVVALSSKTAWAIMVNEFLPSLDKIAQAFVDSKDGANSFAGVLGSVVNSTVQVAALLISDVVFVLTATGREIGAIAAQAVALASLDFKGFSAISDAVKDDAARARVELDKFQDNLVNGTVNIQAAYNKRKGFGEVLKDGARGINLLRSLGVDGEAKKALAEANRELEEQNRLIAENAGLTASFAKDWGMLSKMFLLGKLSLDQLTEAQAKLLAKQPFAIAEAKASADLIKAQSKAASDGIKFMQAENKAYEDHAKVLRASEKAIEDYADSAKLMADDLVFETQLIGLNTAERERAIEQRKIQLELDKELRRINDTAGLTFEEKESQKAIAMQAAVSKASTAAARSSLNEWVKTADSIRDSIVDAFDSAILTGKDLFTSLRDAAVKLFDGLVLRPILQGVLQPVATALTGSLIGNAANAATGASATSGVLSSVTGIGASAGAGSISSLLGSSSMGALDLMGFDPTTIGIALGVAFLSSLGGKFISATDSGRARVDYNAAGVGGSAYSTTGDAAQIAAATKNTNTLAKSYYDTAKSLGITAMQAAFEVGTNTGREGANPQTVLGVNIGKVGYSSGEISSGDSAGLQLAASRAVLTALQASEMPSYLAGVFDNITASTATQEQITAALAYAGSLKTIREALLETREPLQIVKDNVADAFVSLGTSAETFKTDFVAAIDGGITGDALSSWQALGTGLDTLAADSKAAADSLAKTNRTWQDQLDILTGSETSRSLALRDATDETTKSLMRQVYAQQDLKDSTEAAIAAQKDSLSANLDAATAGAANAFAALQRAVDAQRATDTAKYEADKAIATAAYTSQQTLMQASIDRTRASLDAVTASVGKLKSLSNSLKSTLDGMRIAGSENAYRAAAQAQISAALATARSGGGLPLDGQLASALSTVSKPSEQLFATFEDYARDFYKTANDISALSGLTDAQLTADELTQKILQAQSETLTEQSKLLKDGFHDQVSVLDDILSNAQKQLDAANGLDVSVLSVAAALANFNASISALAAERTAQALPTSGASKAADYMATNADVAAAYKENTFGLGATDYANVHFGLYGKDEGRASPVADTKAKSYFELYPDVAAAFADMSAAEKAKYDIETQVKFSARHYANFGINEGRIFPGFESGINYVPYDMTARIHEGEEIVPARFNPYNPNAQPSGNNETATALRALAERLDRIEANTRATAGHTAGTDRKLARVIPGNALITEAA